MSNDKMQEAIKDLACDFFYWWRNQPGTNARHGFDDYAVTVVGKARIDDLLSIALTQQPPRSASESMAAADALYQRGYDDRTQERGYDPRGSKEWQAVVGTPDRCPHGIRYLEHTGERSKSGGSIDE